MKVKFIKCMDMEFEDVVKIVEGNKKIKSIEF